MNSPYGKVTLAVVDTKMAIFFNSLSRNTAGALSYKSFPASSYPLYKIGQYLNPVLDKGSSYISVAKNNHKVILNTSESNQCEFGT